VDKTKRPPRATISVDPLAARLA